MPGVDETNGARVELCPVFEADIPFLAEMALLAAFPPGPLPERAGEMPRAVCWTEDWGRTGDAGVVAWRGGQRIGAAWRRIQAVPIATDASGKSLPEVIMAVSAGQRSRGVGERLLTALAVDATASGQVALSLTVHPTNLAQRLYDRCGFAIIQRDSHRLTMVKHLRPDQNEPGQVSSKVTPDCDGCAD